MGYSFTIKDSYRVKVAGEYPWPCKGEPERTIYLSTTDVLTMEPDGRFTKHTGLGCIHIEVPRKAVKKHRCKTNLRII